MQSFIKFPHRSQIELPSILGEETITSPNKLSRYVHHRNGIMIVFLRLCCSQLASSLRLTVDPLILDVFLIEIALDFDAVGTVVCSDYPVAHDQKYETNKDILFVWSIWERISENKIYMGNSFICSA